jgi:subtilisin family serine protease
MARKFSGRVKHRYRSAMRGFSVNMTRKQARRLAADTRVAYVQQNRVFRIKDVQQNPPSHGVDRIDQRDLPLDKAYNFAGAGEGVSAYVIDTGIRASHQEFAGRVTTGVDTVDNDGDSDDCNGHGTHVAATVGGSTFGVAKAVKLVGVRVLDCKGAGSDATVIAGIDWVTQNAVKPAVANLSLGGPIDPALDRAIQSSIASGVTYSIAAGNETQNACNTSPARTPEAITVGAVDEQDTRAGFSNFGRCVDIFAPGTDITSAAISSPTATATLSGTSMAAPHVAGAAALVLGANPNADPAQVRSTLVGNATQGKVTNRLGSPNALLFTGVQGQQQPTGNPGAPQDPAPPAPATPSPGNSPPPPATPDPGASPTPAPSTPPAAGTPPRKPPKPAPADGSCGTFATARDTAIPNPGITTSPITVSGCGGKALARTRVDVHIKHPYRGDLTVELVAPDGTSYRLKRLNSRDTAANVDGFGIVDASGEVRNGTWQLRVTDTFRGDAGYIDAWSITV